MLQTMLRVIILLSISCNWTNACFRRKHVNATSAILKYKNEPLFRSPYLDRSDIITARRSQNEPLFLSPYLDQGDIIEARKLAKVSFTKSRFNIPSYAGFFTVNDTYSSNHFIWYFPAKNGDVAAPLIVWLAGGPGASSIYGLFMENGPFRVINGKFVLMSDSLIEKYNVVYIDNPVGVGFSFTNYMAGYLKDEDIIGEQLYSTVIQFLTLFPELNRVPLYVLGVSYGGKYAPALAYKIHQSNQVQENKVNLRGVMIGNGFTDPINQIQYGNYFYQLGLIDKNQKAVFDEFEEKITVLIQKERWNDAWDLIDTLLLKSLIKVPTIFQNMTGIMSLTNYLSTTADVMTGDFVPLLPKMREYLHVGDLPFSTNIELIKKTMQSDMLKSVAPWVAELLNHYKVLVYCGQLDIMVPYPLTVNYLSKLNFNGVKEYQKADREIWRVDGEVAGYRKRAGNLVEALVRNAGHMAATDQPKWVLSLISDFINDEF